MFVLQRLYAFLVTPQRGATDADVHDPSGGAIRLTTEIREVVENAFTKISRGNLTKVDFELDKDRTHPVRDDIIAIAFGATQTPKAASARLAARLAQTMDNRSHSALLALAVEVDDPKRRVSLLVFPREDVVQLQIRATEEEPLLNLLRNAFSTRSGLRKLARVEGHQSKTQFLSVEVLDLQLAASHKTTADFWIKRFLHAKPRVDSKTASRQLASALQRAFDAAEEEERDAVFAAMFKASSGAADKTSLTRVAEKLPKALHEPFFRGVPEEMRDSIFEIDRGVMKEDLARRVITAKDGVIISAPANTVGKSVELVTEGSHRTVRYAGAIEKERVVRDRRERIQGSKT
jgi:hypothetical protein